MKSKEGIELEEFFKTSKLVCPGILYSVVSMFTCQVKMYACDEQSFWGT